MSEHIVEIYTNSTEEFLVGIIFDEVDQYYLIKSIDPEGRNDGICCMKKNIIQNLEQNTIYIDRVKMFMEYQQTILSEEVVLEKIDDLFDMLKETQRYVDIYVDREEIISGIILDTDSDSVLIICIGDYGEIEVKETIDKKDIDLIHYDGVEQRLMEHLVSQKYK